MAAKKKQYVCIAPFGCSFPIGKKLTRLEFGATLKLTASQAQELLAAKLIEEAPDGN